MKRFTINIKDRILYFILRSYTINCLDITEADSIAQGLIKTDGESYDIIEEKK